MWQTKSHSDLVAIFNQIIHMNEKLDVNKSDKLRTALKWGMFMWIGPFIFTIKSLFYLEQRYKNIQLNIYIYVWASDKNIWCLKSVGADDEQKLLSDNVVSRIDIHTHTHTQIRRTGNLLRYTIHSVSAPFHFHFMSLTRTTYIHKL